MIFPLHDFASSHPTDVDVPSSIENFNMPMRHRLRENGTDFAIRDLQALLGAADGWCGILAFRHWAKLMHRKSDTLY
ncbi:hypothetical protein [Methyloversatilis sp. XJ19-49]|uniref:hypothetical protein n=1 Tax=Methyloversatilis sp. XJ19-49 TaxID=2963429 RepID=UPI00211B7941|nr:hypothetical protein [Methyloversatilis sp. XJ19-49]MCQ9378275.1 hypothetical protein [Methyloversatilis sp. XJ19-49]